MMNRRQNITGRSVARASVLSLLACLYSPGAFGVGSAPSFVATPTSVSVREGESAFFTVTAYDDDGTVDIYHGTLPIWLNVEASSSGTTINTPAWMRLRTSPGYNNSGTHTVRFWAISSTFPKTSPDKNVTINVIEVTDPPQFEPTVEAVDLVEGETLAKELKANDPTTDTDRMALHVSDFQVAPSPPSWASHVDTVGNNTITVKLTGKAPPLPSGLNLQVYDIYVTVSDGDAIDTATVKATVRPNPAPVLDPIPDQITPTGKPFRDIPLSNYVRDVNNRPDEMTWKADLMAVDPPELEPNPPLNIAFFSQTARITVTNQSWTGYATYLLTVTDPFGKSDLEEVTFARLERVVNCDVDPQGAAIKGGIAVDINPNDPEDRFEAGLGTLISGQYAPYGLMIKERAPDGFPYTPPGWDEDNAAPMAWKFGAGQGGEDKAPSPPNVLMPYPRLVLAEGTVSPYDEDKWFVPSVLCRFELGAENGVTDLVALQVDLRGDVGESRQLGLAAYDIFGRKFVASGREGNFSVHPGQALVLARPYLRYAEIENLGVTYQPGDTWADIKNRVVAIDNIAFRKVEVAPRLERIEVLPAAAAILEGEEVLFAARAVLSNGDRVEDLSFSWSVEDGRVASIRSVSGNTGEAKVTGGDVTGVEWTRVFAAFGEFTGSAFLEVRESPIEAIAVLPGRQSAWVNDTARFAALAAGGGVVTSQCAWSSSNLPVAVPLQDSPGAFQARAKGQSEIRAQYGSVNSPAAVLEVLDPNLISITDLDVTPPSAYADIGECVELTAVARTSDGQERTVTGVAAWTSSRPDVAMLIGPGLVFARSCGSAVLEARYGAFSASAALTVGDVSSFWVEPKQREAFVGAFAQFSAYAMVDEACTGDVRLRDVTAVSGWMIDKENVAAPAGAGRFQAIRSGTAAVTARFGERGETAALAVKNLPDAPKASLVFSRVIPRKLTVPPWEEISGPPYAVAVIGKPGAVTINGGNAPGQEVVHLKLKNLTRGEEYPGVRVNPDGSFRVDGVNATSNQDALEFYAEAAHPVSGTVPGAKASGVLAVGDVNRSHADTSLPAEKRVRRGGVTVADVFLIRASYELYEQAHLVQNYPEYDIDDSGAVDATDVNRADDLAKGRIL